MRAGVPGVLVALGLASWVAACGKDGNGSAPGPDPGAALDGMPGAQSSPPAASGSAGTGSGQVAPAVPSPAGASASEGAPPVAGIDGTGSPPLLAAPEPVLSEGSEGTIPIIGGPPPPAISIAEFAIPNPSQPGWITAGPDGSVWFTHQSTAPSAISKASLTGAPVIRYNTSVTNTG